MKFVIVVFGLTIAWCAAGCGGGASSKAVAPPPINTPLTIVTTTLPHGAYTQFYSTQLQATGGRPPYVWFAIDPEFPPGLSLSERTGGISGVIAEFRNVFRFTVAVIDSQKNIVFREFDLTLDSQLIKILTTALPDATVSQNYDVLIATNDPRIAMANFVEGSGQLPPGMRFEGSHVRGSPSEAGSFQFDAEAISDGASSRDRRTFVLRVRPTGERNDSTSTATRLSNGFYAASISPFADPASVANPDHDYYQLTAQGGSIVSIATLSQRLSPSAPLDSVIEVVDSTGGLFGTCAEPGETNFQFACLNDDDLQAFTLDSHLLFKVPGSGPVPFFLHVFDWRGDARPDFEYQLRIFGAN